jgi:hypothetical protein
MGDVAIESFERIKAMADILWQAATSGEMADFNLESVRHYALAIEDLAEKGLKELTEGTKPVD